MKMTIIILAAALTMAGCMNRRATVPETQRDYIVSEDVTSMSETDLIREAGDDGHTAQNALDYAGTYKGTLPCADCSGIETTLTLDGDGTYKLTSKYLEKNDSLYTSEGTYSWSDNGRAITLDGGDAHGNRYFVAEGALYALDRDGNRIDGPNAEHYMLRKQ